MKPVHKKTEEKKQNKNIVGEMQKQNLMEP